jgi:hypothetical protein
MAGIYTPSGGNTTQGIQNQNMMSTLASITGSPAAAALATSSQAGPDYAANPNIAQLSDEEEKMRTMFAHDQALAAQYSNPNLYGGAATPPANNPAGAFSSPLQATIESITNPQGTITPQGLIGMIGGDVTGQKDTLGNIMDAMNFNETRSLDAYKAMLGALGTIYGEEQANKRAKMQYGESGGDSDIVDAYVEQVKGGLEISSIPDEKVRGAVVKRLAEGGWTPEKIKKNIEGKQILSVMKSVKEAWNDSTSGGLPSGGPFGAYGIAKTVAGYSKAEPDVETYLRYKNAIVSSLRSLVGEKGILSNQDMERIQNLLPDYILTKEQADKSWSNVRKLLNSKYGEDIVNEYFGTDTGNTSANTSGNVSASYPKLKDPTTGKIYEYDSVSDSDYISDLNSGFQPQ